jgi:hypothetical protein
MDSIKKLFSVFRIAGQRDFIVGTAVDVVKNRRRQPALRQLLEITGIKAVFEPQG